MIQPQRLQDIVTSFDSAKILVVGDLMLDRFIWGKVNRVSPEAPVPVVKVTRETAHLGGSANVVANLEALGAQSIPVGILGEDSAGRTLAASLSEKGVSTEGLIFEPGLETIQKIRIVAHNQQVVRVDREQQVTLNVDQEERLCSAVDRLLPECNAVIVSDYGKSVVTKVLLDRLSERPEPILLAIDPKEKNFDFYRGADIITPNHDEAERLAGMTIEPRSPSLNEAARRIFARLDCRHLLITLGDHGMALFLGPDAYIAIPTQAREVYDVSGAGDTVIATYTLAWSVGASVHEAAVLANAAAGVVVGKLGTATTSQEELLAALEGPS